jgi:iron-sulfur cluster assembly protein
MLTLSEAAVAQIRWSAAQSGCEGAALRVAARLGADGSLDYGMGFDDPTDDDLNLEFDGLLVLVAPSSQPLLDGTTLDFVEIEPGQPAFIFVPPQHCATDTEKAARGGCGSGACGNCRSA